MRSTNDKYLTMNVFLALDGLDGTGKSTQQRLLCDWLRERGHDVVACRDPGTTPLGERIRTLLLARDSVAIDRRAEMLLYMAARAQMVREVIEPALAAGKSVVSDRYLLANVVYQGHAGGLDPAAIWRVGRIATGGLLPHLVIVLDMPPDAAATRIQRQRDRMEEQGDDFSRRVREGFLAEAANDPQGIVVINAAQSIEAVYADIRTAVENVL
ncbi:MAG TPA: dTMP kinase [Pirellulales bacterium]|jgi:dTMP kinase|nr:dTMP kinase [Pirellulales bacterium]